MTYAKARAEFSAAMIAEFGDRKETRAAVRELFILANAHMTRSVEQCNGPTDRERAARGFDWDEWEETRAASERETERRILAIAETIGARVKLGGDPRGFTVKLMMPKTGAYNSWGGAEEGFGVPTRPEC